MLATETRKEGQEFQAPLAIMAALIGIPMVLESMSFSFFPDRAAEVIPSGSLLQQGVDLAADVGAGMAIAL